jgi:hypothetical protein
MRHGSPRLDRVRGRFRNRLSEGNHDTAEASIRNSRIVGKPEVIRFLRLVGQSRTTFRTERESQRSNDALAARSLNAGPERSWPEQLPNDTKHPGDAYWSTYRLQGSLRPPPTQVQRSSPARLPLEQPPPLRSHERLCFKMLRSIYLLLQPNWPRAYCLTNC